MHRGSVLFVYACMRTRVCSIVYFVFCCCVLFVSASKQTQTISMFVMCVRCTHAQGRCTCVAIHTYTCTGRLGKGDVIRTIRWGLPHLIVTLVNLLFALLV